MSMLARLKCVDEIDLAGQRVLVRSDLDVPGEGEPLPNEVDARIERVLPTLQQVMQAGAKLVVAAHRGCPKGRVVPAMGLEPVGARLAEISGWEVLLPDDSAGDAARKAVSDLHAGQMVLLENLRFAAGELSNDEGFARRLARLAEIYVNDALAASSRAHASVCALPPLMKQRSIGLRMKADLAALDRLANPELAMAALIGGTRLTERISLLRALSGPGRTFCMGGTLGCTLLAAGGVDMGATRIDNGDLAHARTILGQMRESGAKILFPTDVVATRDPKSADSRVVAVTHIAKDEHAVDVGPETLARFQEAVRGSATALWVGAMGLAGHPQHGAGTQQLARILAESRAIGVALGQAAASAIRQLDPTLAERIVPFADSGGAALELVEGRKLPGLEVLKTAEET